MRNDVPSQLDRITPCFVVLVDAKETLAFLVTGCQRTIISQRLHNALIKESLKAAMAFQQNHNFNPLMHLIDQLTNGNFTHYHMDQLASATPCITDHTDQLTSATPCIIDTTP
uniref:Uncharacterized protein n=1 Tax=Romanomermis culicivorax TaxID=13658 RepID=A0A915I376_ROMCU